MTHCTRSPLRFSNRKRRKVEANFNGGEVTGNGGVMLVSEQDRRLGLTARIARLLGDARRQASCRHSRLHLLRQRLYALCLGYEDLNDHDELRHDAALQTAVGEDRALASASTLCRFESRAERSWMVSIHQVLVELFIESFAEAPEELILDFDATDDRVHGSQEGRAYHGYYRSHCFLPLYVFSGEQLLVSYLRPGNTDPAKHAGAILCLLVKRLRRQWPGVRILFRGDSGFCRRRIMDWCERHDVQYLTGIARNKRITRQSQELLDRSRKRYEHSGQKQRVFGEISYQADTWRCERRVLVKAEQLPKGANPRYVVTNLTGDPQQLYDEVYCARGEMENRIKEQQLDLFADRTSCSLWWPNQYRMLLSGLAYVLLEQIRRTVLYGTRLSRATVGTIRLKLLRLGAVIVRNTRRVVFLLSGSYPYPDLFRLAVQRLVPG